MSREVVLGRVRAACGRGPGAGAGVRSGADAGVRSGDPPALPAPVVADDPVGLFVERAREVGVHVEMVASLDEAAARALAWCGARDAQRAAVWGVPDLAPVITRLQEAGVEILGPGAAVDALAETEVGITGADWGIAETGSLVLAAGPDRPRLASLLPPAHLAVLRADRIVPDLATLFGRCGPPPSALTFITGPSRSADIGLVPTLGAHGPMEVAVLVVG